MSVSPTLILPFYFFAQKHQRIAQAGRKRLYKSAREGSLTRAFILNSDGSLQATTAASAADHAWGHPRTPGSSVSEVALSHQPS